MGLFHGLRTSDDDFVPTILDDDAEIPNLDDASLTEAEITPETTNGKKRKREEANGESNNTKRQKKKKKTGKKDKSLAQSDDAPANANGDEQLLSGTEENGGMDSEFEFQIESTNLGRFEDFDGWGLEESKSKQSLGGDKKAVDIDDIIARRREKVDTGDSIDMSSAGIQHNGESMEQDSGDESSFAAFGDEDEESLTPDTFGVDVTMDGEDQRDSSVEEGTRYESGSEDDDAVEHVPHPDDLVIAEEHDEDEEDELDPVEAERRAAFFAPESSLHDQSSLAGGATKSFLDMSLSRPILRALAAVGFSTATPIQSKTIPIALLGKDIVGGAITGSGKTAAFIIPILERLLYRPKKIPTTRVVVLVPTRELAVQCFNVATKLASFTDITFAQLIGGYSQREQEQQLKKRPDIVIATPGRFIDHMINTASFTVDTIEILVLDEADRMLEDGFANELDNVLKTLPKSRQTMLFSATMTDSVDKLIRVGLNRPVRLMIDAKRQTVSGLVQEFVRLRPGKEDKRLAYLLYLCTEVYTDRVIVFFRQKREAHRVRVVFGLCGLKAAELHGSMSQEQVSIYRYNGCIGMLNKSFTAYKSRRIFPYWQRFFSPCYGSCLSWSRYSQYHYGS